MNTKYVCWLAVALVAFLQAGCSDGEKELPVLGEVGQNYQFINQDSQWVNQDTFKGKVRVVDFFFTTCPTICPKMTSQMLRVHDALSGQPDFALLSHTIDIRHDSVPVLRRYAEGLGVASSDWHMVTGEKEQIFEMAKAYMVSAAEDQAAPGGYMHSGAFILLDRQNRIRGYYDGTSPEETNQLIADIELLLE